MPFDHHYCAADLAKPSFWFTIDRMRVNRNAPPDEITPGIWIPPRMKNGNLKQDGETTDVLFLFDGTNVQRWEGATPTDLGLHSYRTMSIYYDVGRFWIVPYDATKYTVGEGGAHQAALETSDDSDSDSDDEDEDEDFDPTVEDWAFVAFQHDIDPLNGYASYIMRRGDRQKLRVQRPSQRWAHTLLPRHFHAEQGTPDNYPQYGGMIGELNIIIGLFAFSVRSNRVEDTLTYCMHNGQFRGPNIDNDHIGRGCKYRCS